MSNSSVLIVDPVSSGKLYPRVLERYAIETILLDTDHALVSEFRTTPTPGALDFTADFGNSYDLLLKMCADRSVGYVVAGSEPGVELAERLRADIPGCPAGDTVLPMRRWDKQYMFEALAAAGVPTLTTRAVPPGRAAVPADAVAEARAGRKLVVKPARGAASVGVRLVATPDETVRCGLGDHRRHRPVRRCLGRSDPGDVSAPRVEYAVDTFSTPAGHEFVCVSVYDKWVSASGDFVYERGRWLDHDDPVVGELADYACRVLDALGVRVGPAHMEIMSGSLGPRLIDFGARAHGIGHPQHTHLLTGNSQIHRECEYIAELFGISVPAAERRTGYALSRHGALVLLSIDRRSGVPGRSRRGTGGTSRRTGGPDGGRTGPGLSADQIHDGFGGARPGVRRRGQRRGTGFPVHRSP